MLHGFVSFFLFSMISLLSFTLPRIHAILFSRQAHEFRLKKDIYKENGILGIEAATITGRKPFVQKEFCVRRLLFSQYFNTACIYFTNAIFRGLSRSEISRAASSQGNRMKNCLGNCMG